MNPFLIFNSIYPVLLNITMLNIQWLRSKGPFGQPWSKLHPSARNGHLIYLPLKTGYNGELKGP